MENEVGSVFSEHDAGWSTPSSPTRVAEPRRASTRDEWRGIVNPRARRGRSETTPRRGVERRGFPYPRCRREPVDGVTRVGAHGVVYPCARRESSLDGLTWEEGRGTSYPRA
ncbi:hypothetical protein F2Q68_00007522 [Brassica cretica]|uniref:Uncharacterized protein n=1 Tax=Brassica cretica TaxID=69181 RepID=A0A8S9L2K4_BRACR|nr:hypothetical protein F2Q68_00007522 [Brassica cretica]